MFTLINSVKILYLSAFCESSQESHNTTQRINYYNTMIYTNTRTYNKSKYNIKKKELFQIKYDYHNTKFFDILKQTTHLFSQNILAITQRAKEQ